MENASTSPESFSSRKPLTHQEAQEAKDILKEGLKSSGLKFMVGTLSTEKGFIVTIGAYDKDMADAAKALAHRYIPDIPFEVHVTGTIQAG